MRKLRLWAGVLVGVGLMGAGVARGQWSEPIQLTPQIGGIMHADFDIALDSHNRIDAVYTLLAYEFGDDSAKGLQDRTMFQQFDIDGRPLTEPIELVDGIQHQYDGRLVVDAEDNVHIICSTLTWEWDNVFYYTRFDSEGQRVLDPVAIEGTISRTTDWATGDSKSFFFRRSDGNFVLAALPSHTVPGDTITDLYASYILFDSTGHSLIEPQLLWHGNQLATPPISYFNLSAHLDKDDNLHFTWRRTQYGITEAVMYACVSAGNDIIQEPTVVTPAVNPRNGGGTYGIYAFDLNTIFTLRYDNPYQGEPYQVYLQRITSAGDEVWHAPVFITDNSSSTIKFLKTFWHGQFFFAGRTTPNPDSSRVYYHYYTSMDTSGNVGDSLELIKIMPTNRELSITNFICAEDRKVGFYRANDERHQNRCIMMIQKPDTSYNKVVTLFSPTIPNLVSLQVFPQPCNPSSNIQIQNRIPGILDVSLYLIDGRLIGATRYYLTTTGSSTYPFINAFPAVSLPTGQYYLTWVFNNESFGRSPITIIR